MRFNAVVTLHFASMDRVAADPAPLENKGLGLRGKWMSFFNGGYDKWFTKMIDGTYRQTNLPKESAEYLPDCEDVRHAEIELMKQRGARRSSGILRLLSAGENTFNYDLGSEDRAGQQDWTISVFTLRK